MELSPRGDPMIFHYHNVVPRVNAAGPGAR
jgi:hypothetical protein